MIILTILIDYLISFYFFNSFTLCISTVYIINRIYFYKDKKVLIYASIYDLFFNNKLLLYLIITYLIYNYILILNKYLKKNYLTYLFTITTSITITLLIKLFLISIIDYRIGINYLLSNLFFKLLVSTLISIIYLILSNKKHLSLIK